MVLGMESWRFKVTLNKSRVHANSLERGNLIIKFDHKIYFLYMSLD